MACSTSGSATPLEPDMDDRDDDGVTVEYTCIRPAKALTSECGWGQFDAGKRAQYARVRHSSLREASPFLERRLDAPCLPHPVAIASLLVEHSGNIMGPKYSIRLRDLRQWHMIIATCIRCRHRARLEASFLAWDRPSETYLVDLQRKLRCSRCGNRAENTLSVRALSRN